MSAAKIKIVFSITACGEKFERPRRNTMELGSSRAKKVEELEETERSCTESAASFLHAVMFSSWQ